MPRGTLSLRALFFVDVGLCINVRLLCMSVGNDCSRKSGLAQWRWMEMLRHWRSVLMATNCSHMAVC